ncbi:hypothetical protein SteCoe_5913 [Stentor coeruleus]|uniref:Ubiquitin-like domain-containing protein n=1 Tax=Stentor coeruleus TaxID=5963 RepID=A0A1R2CRB0_9CILI|nr:hypothetical protein SteCoe_5913 [Stentor coeruleus]
MGNCCKVAKKEKEPRKATVESGTISTEDRSQRKKTLSIICESLNINLSLRYRPAIPLQDLKEQIITECPSLEINKFSLFRDDLEVLDATATLQQLGISPGDTLQIKIKEESVTSEDIIASENNSIIEPNEELKTTEINGVTAKKGLAARNIRESELVSPKKPAKELWRTALPSPPPPGRQLINCDPMDASSLTNNTHDRSLKAPQATFQVKLPNGMIESDDSNMEDRKGQGHRENSANFQDLKGPFYMFQNE